jgi:type IV secretory pathway VirD2 relaxase
MAITKSRTSRTEDGIRIFEDRERRIRVKIRGERTTPKLRIRGIKLPPGSLSQGIKPGIRRVTIKASFVKNNPKLPWSKHGFYRRRESAQKRAFDVSKENVDLASKLGRWQEEGDRHMFRIILSPEDADRLDLESYTREYMKRLEKGLGTKLEWAAVEHDNTDHPHVHIVLRGKDDRGQDLVLSKDTIKSGLRTVAQDLATEELGLRSPEEILASREKTLENAYMTEVDRGLLFRAKPGPTGARILTLPKKSGSGERAEKLRQDRERLEVLGRFGLARQIRGDTWQLADNTEEVLKGMGLMRDITKRRAAVEGNASRTGLPFSLSWAGEKLSGKILGSGPVSEMSEEKYLFIEGQDGRMYYETTKGMIPPTGTPVTLQRDQRNRVRILTDKGGRQKRTSPHPEKGRE